MISTGRGVALMLGVLLLAGCATPASRIKKNPELFASFPPEVQAKVREGQIEVGYTHDMVRMALGGPQRIHTRTTQGGATEVWVYTDIAYRSRLEPVESTYWYRSRRGDLHPASSLSWVDLQQRHEYVVLRIEFEGDKVKAIEALR
jgi:hypothetical protein